MRASRAGALMASAAAWAAMIGIAACSGSSTETAPSGGGGGSNTSTTAACKTDADCESKIPPTSPASCAAGKCDAVQGACTFVAKDADGDGHAAASCKSTNGSAVQAGDDCDDTDPKLFPGHPDDCSATTDGKAIAWPTGAPVGQCHYGKVSCVNGAKSACVGAQAPVARDCKSALDNDCDGKPDNTMDAVCSCTPGQTYPCSSDANGPFVFPAGSWPAGTPAPGSICKLGTALCGPDGTQQTCSGAQRPEPRDCSSKTADDDCDGIIDNLDTACECDGTVTIGTTKPCDQHAGKDGIGICHAGAQGCVVNPKDPTTATWDPTCVGSQGALQAICESPLDNNCDGVIDDTPCASQAIGGGPNPLLCKAQQCGPGGACAADTNTSSSYCPDVEGDGYCGPQLPAVSCAAIDFDTWHRQCPCPADACEGQRGHVGLGQAGCAAVGDCCPAPAGTTMSCLGGTCKACASVGSSCTQPGATGCCAGTKCNGSSVCQTCAALGGGCATTADCCKGSCVGGLCANVVCKPTGASCSSNAQCCNGACPKINNVFQCN